MSDILYPVKKPGDAIDACSVEVVPDRVDALAGGGAPAGTRRSSIEQLQFDLAAFNRCIEGLEKADADPQDIEVLTTMR
jgi:hypothetical protein